jgi:hypothetical protein
LYRHKYERGSYTVEISIVFPLVVLAVLALLFSFLYMQQKAYLVSAASFAAQQGAELWRDSRRNIENGELIGTGTENSYGYRILDNLLLSRKTFEGYLKEEKGADGKSKLVLIMDVGNNLPGQKVALIGEALCRRIENTALKPEKTRVKLIYSNNGLRGRLSVEIMQEINVPLGGIKKFFDGKETLTLSGESTASVTEPAEYIRNIDLAIELSRRIEGELDLMGLLDKLGAKGQK